MSNSSEPTDEAPRPPPGGVSSAEPSVAPESNAPPTAVGDPAREAAEVLESVPAVPDSAAEQAETSLADSPVATPSSAPDSEPDGLVPDATEASPSDPADPAKKKRRRRRRRKKKPGEASEAGQTEAPAAKKPTSPAPLTAFIEAAGGAKRHAFSVGEIVAGRVTAVAGGTIVVDLFGKATAVIDEYEPREVEPLPEVSPPEVEPPTDLPAHDVPSADAEARDSAEESMARTGSSAPVENPPIEGPVPTPDASVIEAEAFSAESAPESSAGEVDAAPAHDGTEPSPAADAEEEAKVDLKPAPPEAPPEEEGPPPEPPEIGSIFRGRVGAVSESGHIALVNRAIDRAQAKARLASARDEHRRVRGVVFGFNRGGFDVVVHGIRAFCPASGMALEAIADPHAHVGKKYEFSVQARKASGQGFVVSRRGLLEREARKLRRARLRALEVGSVVTGRVTQVRDFGVFVDIGDGLEGLVHQSEMSWSRGVRPADVASAGDEVKVQILKVGADKKKEDGPKKRDRQPRVGLSIKALEPDPWDAHPGRAPRGPVEERNRGQYDRLRGFRSAGSGHRGTDPHLRAWQRPQTREASARGWAGSRRRGGARRPWSEAAEPFAADRLGSGRDHGRHPRPPRTGRVR